MTTEGDSFRLGVMLDWVKQRAAKSESPSRYMTHYSAQLVRSDKIRLDQSPDYSDPVKLAAQIEVLASLRHLKQGPAAPPHRKKEREK